jgi:hypothetical protein
MQTTYVVLVILGGLLSIFGIYRYRRNKSKKAFKKGLIVDAEVSTIFDRLAPDSIERIVVELEANEVLAMTYYGQEMCAVIGYNHKNDKILKEIDVPNVLIAKALALVKAEKELNDMRTTFTSLLNS